MNKLIIVLALFATLVCTSCGKENFVGIENISFENYPKVEGSTSARALMIMVACKLLNIKYE
jgi:hypothetical protein